MTDKTRDKIIAWSGFAWLAFVWWHSREPHAVIGGALGAFAIGYKFPRRADGD